MKIKDGETDDILDQFEADVLLVEEDKEIAVKSGLMRRSTNQRMS